MRCLAPLALVWLGCGSSPGAPDSAGPPAAPAPAPVIEAPAPIEPVAAAAPAPEPPERRDLEVAVRGVRSGRALHLEIVGVARDRVAGSEFEQPERWEVTAEVDGVALDRVVNGSTTVTRRGTRRPDRWDVTVRFDTAFALPPGDDDAAVTVIAPGAEPSRFTVPGAP